MTTGKSARSSGGLAVSGCHRAVATLLAGAGLLGVHSTRADSINSPNITLNVDTNRATGPGAGNTPVTVNTITLAEIQLAEYQSGSGRAVVLRARPGFQFDPTSNVTALSATFGINGTSPNNAAVLTPAGVENEILTFNLTSGGADNIQDIIRLNGVKLRILNAAGAAGPAQTTLAITTSTAGGAFTDQGLVAATITKGAPDRLVFAVQPGTAQAGISLLPAVQILDFGGNIVTADPRAITLTLSTNPPSAPLLGVTQQQTDNGVAAWVDGDGLRINVAASGFVLRASHDGAPFLTADTVDSAPITIAPAAPGRLIVTRQPADTAAGADILIEVTAVDIFDNPLVSTPIDVTLDSAVNPGGWPLLAVSSLTKTTVNGVAAWVDADDLRINKATADYRLAASGLGTPVETDPFDIAPAAAAALRFVQQPTDAVEDAAIIPPVAVEVIDAFGNRTADSTEITLSLATAPCGGALTGATATAANGLAGFAGLTIDTPCTGDVLAANAAGLAGATSDAFNVTAAPGNGDDDDDDDNGDDDDDQGGGGINLCGFGTSGSLLPLMVFFVAMRRHTGWRASERAKP